MSLSSSDDASSGLSPARARRSQVTSYADRLRSTHAEAGSPILARSVASAASERSSGCVSSSASLFHSGAPSV